MRNVTARQAKQAELSIVPAVKKAMKASRAAKLQRQAEEREALQVEMYGPRRHCQDCGLHFRSHDNRNVCLDCLEK